MEAVSGQSLYNNLRRTGPMEAVLYRSLSNNLQRIGPMGEVSYPSSTATPMEVIAACQQSSSRVRAGRGGR